MDIHSITDAETGHGKKPRGSLLLRGGFGALGATLKVSLAAAAVLDLVELLSHDFCTPYEFADQVTNHCLMQNILFVGGFCKFSRYFMLFFRQYMVIF